MTHISHFIVPQGHKWLQMKGNTPIPIQLQKGFIDYNFSRQIPLVG